MSGDGGGTAALEGFEVLARTSQGEASVMIIQQVRVDCVVHHVWGCSDVLLRKTRSHFDRAPHRF